MYVNVGDGKKASMPRYFKDKIYTDEERKIINEAYVERLADVSAFEFYNSSDPVLDYRNKKAGIEAAYQNNIFKSLKNSHL